MNSVEVSRKSDGIKQQLSRILNSLLFKRSLVLSRFLEFITHETLKGNDQTLKEYIIAVNVLKKSSDFNPQLNGIVRIHANRLRKLLNEYYLNEGINDPITITIPKGRYIPCFKHNLEAKSELRNSQHDLTKALELKPVVAVLPFHNYQKNERIDVVCSVMSHDLTAELSKFPEIGVITSYSAQHASENIKNLKDIISNLGVDYLITGFCVLEGDQIRISIELNACNDHKLLWAETYFLDDFDSDSFHYYRRIIQKVIARTCGFFGLIYRNTLNAHIPVNYDCLYAIYWHNRFHKQFNEESFIETLKAIDKGLKKNPHSALLTAFKGELILNSTVMEVDSKIDNLKYGTDLVKSAISHDATCQHAYQVYAWANLLNHDQIELYRTIDKCLSINPNNPMYIGQMGFGYICAGDYEKGLELMSESINLNPFYTWNLNLGFCYYFMHSEDYEEALLWAEKVNRRKFLWDPMMRASILGWLGRTDESEEVLNELFVLVPEFEKKATRIVNAFLFDRELTNQIINGLNLAGLKINTESTSQLLS